MKLSKTDIHNYLYQSYESKVIYLQNQYFAEELTIICEDNPEYYIVYKFFDCYKNEISHNLDYPKNKLYKNQVIKELPFYLVDWDIEIEDELYIIKMVAFPMYIEIWCKDIKIYKMRKDKFDFSNTDKDLLKDCEVIDDD